MRTYIRLAFAALLLTGCAGSCMQVRASIDGYTKLCIDGATWVFIHGDYAQQQLGLDGKPVACTK